MIFILDKNSNGNEKDYEIFCLNEFSSTVFSMFVNDEILKKEKATDRCRFNYRTNNYVEISKRLYETIKYEQDWWFEKGQKVKETTFWGRTLYYRDDTNFQRDNASALTQLVRSNIDEINNFTKSREELLKAQKSKVDVVKEVKKTEPTTNKNIKVEETKYEKKCEGGVFAKGYKKGSPEFNDCIKREEKLAALEEQKKQIMNEDKNKKVQEKQLSDQVKIKEQQIQISKMSPDDRRAFTCSEKFGFRKGTDKFKDCVFKIYAAEIEMEKLELQRELAKANAETAKARAEAARASDERQERLLQAQTEAAKMQSLAARQQAIASNTAESLALMESGLRMMTPQRPAPRTQTTCTYVGRFLNCY